MHAQVKEDMYEEVLKTETKVWAGGDRGILDLMLAAVSGLQVSRDQPIGDGCTIESAARTGFFTLR